MSLQHNVFDRRATQGFVSGNRSLFIRVERGRGIEQRQFVFIGRLKEPIPLDELLPGDHHRVRRQSIVL